MTNLGLAGGGWLGFMGQGSDVHVFLSLLFSSTVQASVVWRRAGGMVATCEDKTHQTLPRTAH